VTPTPAEAQRMHLKRIRPTPGATRRPKVACHTVRTRDGGKITLKYGRKLAIRLFCTECLGWEDNPKDCTATLCPLYPFRAGTMASLRGHGGKAKNVEDYGMAVARTVQPLVGSLDQEETT
jgi:hypothetical protein